MKQRGIVYKVVKHPVFAVVLFVGAAWFMKKIIFSEKGGAKTGRLHRVKADPRRGVPS